MTQNQPQSMSAYPATIKGHLDAPLSRWLWLLKILLVIPHVIVLLLLSVAVAIATLIAFFAIVITGKYPRGLFDFNQGVMRWSWRVGFYSYQAMGTDKYPPFSLDSLPDYPADLKVEYPAKLSRWMPLVKWLLALPHYLIVGVFGGGIGSSKYGGLTLLLVIVSGISLLFTGKYPQGLYKLIIGMNRWSIRLAAYVLLMTDKYPPFSMDMEEEG